MAEVLDLRGPDHSYDFRLLPGGNHRFWPRWKAMDRGYVILATYGTSWAITEYPGTNSFDTDDVAAADHFWRGGCAYLFDDDNGLLDALILAGYTTGYEEIYIDKYTETYGPSGVCS